MRGHVLRIGPGLRAPETPISVSHCEIMNTTTPPYAMTATDLAAMHSLTPRRVTQYRDDGHITPLSRGLFDAGWFSHLRAGEALCKNHRRKPAAFVLVACGWLHAVGSRATEDRAHLVALFVRNGHTAEDALQALGEARAVMRSQ